MTVDLQQKPMPPDRHASSEDAAADEKSGGKPQSQVPSPNSTGMSSFLIKDILSPAAAANHRTPGQRGHSPPLGSSPPMGIPPLGALHHPMQPPPYFLLDHRRPNGSGHFSPHMEDEDDVAHSSEEELSRDAGNGKWFEFFFCIRDKNGGGGG
ncbi:uncharacterized protein TNCT_61771 [Trichonephila clavata]|uniref:Uncharacterized protein n=1 Tax=Trichonephila clavata TaxID=2740835 RepID=A0A8X6G794_TRICU|nr:uncharacterized protein TNCT_61771 [Trichonephila clavata]